MKTIQTSQQAGPDGKLRLEIPVDRVGHTYHVLVILDEQPTESRTAGEWPPGYLDSTIGKWQGDFVCESEAPSSIASRCDHLPIGHQRVRRVLAQS
jgi:hypothetical protein